MRTISENKFARWSRVYKCPVPLSFTGSRLPFFFFLTECIAISFGLMCIIEMLWLFPGSGKTTFLHRLVCHTHASNIRGYVMNLDPAVMTLPFGANIDIRDTVRYKEVMKQFNLGPNGGILTSLNLFATKFDEVKFHASLS